MIGFRSASACASGHAPLQPPEQVHVPDPFDEGPAREGDRQVDIGASPHEPLRHHPDDGADLVVEAELPADHGGVAAELPLPEPVAEDGDRRRIRPAVVGEVGPSEERRHAHDEERVRRAVVAAQALRVALAGPQDVGDRGRDRPFEDRVPFGDLEELVGAVAEAASAPARVPDADAHQRVDVLIGERIQDDRVDDAVHRGRRHDPEGQRQHRQRGEAGRAGKGPDPVAQVLKPLVEPRQHGISLARLHKDEANVRLVGRLLNPRTA